MKKQKPDIPFADRDAYTIEEFCVANGISRSSYYNMTPEDRPVEMVIGGSKRISREARFDWRRRMETKAAEARAAERDDTVRVAERAAERDDTDADGNDADGDDDAVGDDDAEAA